MQPANVKCISENAGSKGLGSLNKHSKVVFYLQLPGYSERLISPTRKKKKKTKIILGFLIGYKCLFYYSVARTECQVVDQLNLNLSCLRMKFVQAPFCEHVLCVVSLMADG